jgi:hypothetical protein
MRRRKRDANMDAAHEAWWYRLECRKRWPGYEKILKSIRENPETAPLEWLGVFHEEMRVIPSCPIASDGRSWVTVKLDLRYPIPLLLALLEEQLRPLKNDPEALTQLRDTSAYREAVLDRLRWHPPSPYAQLVEPTRLHLQMETLRLRLTVWDMAKEGATFKEIATQLKKHASTVRDLYGRVAMDILGRPSPRGRRRRLLIGFDPETHTSTCPICMKATKEPEFCPAWRAYLGPAELKDWAIQDEKCIAEYTRDKLPSKSRKAPTRK